MLEKNQIVFLLAFSYLIGSILMSRILALCGVIKNPLNYGSKNPGATNVARQSKLMGLITLCFDFAKSFVLISILSKSSIPQSILSLCGAFVVLGHIAPIYNPYHGGKGVATTMGVVVALTPLTAALIIIIFSIPCIALKNVGISSVIASFLGLVVHLIFIKAYAPLYIFLSLLIIYRHQSNIIQFYRSIKNPKAI